MFEEVINISLLETNNRLTILFLIEETLASKE